MASAAAAASASAGTSQRRFDPLASPISPRSNCAGRVSTAPAIGLQLAAMVTQMRKVLDGLGVSGQQGQRVLTEASIVQAEGSRPQDFGKIARVIDNRLARGMKLQLDSTVSYAVGKRTVTTSKDERATDSPYNTYAVTGLPAGPIGNPGETTLKAALNPASGSWLYWVVVNLKTGETVFSDTLAEHNAAVQKFRDYCRTSSAC